MPSMELSPRTMPVALPTIWRAIRHPASVPQPTLVPASGRKRAALDVLHVHGLWPEWRTDDFTTAMIAAIASAPPLEQLKLLPLYPDLVYCIRLLRDDAHGRERLLELARQVEV